MQWSAGAFFLPIAIHVVLIVATGAFSAESRECTITAALCGTPFEPFVSSFELPRGLNVFFKAWEIGWSFFKMLVGLLILNYEILTAQQFGLASLVADGFRIACGMILAGTCVSGAVLMIRR